MPFIISSEIADGVEALTLDGLALHSGAYRLESWSWRPAPKRYEWVQGGDSNGAVLGRDPLHDNIEMTCRVVITPQATMDAALSLVAAISDKLEEAERNERGVDLAWLPKTSALPALTFECLSGEITDVPKVMQGEDAGYFQFSPVVYFTMVCSPFARGAEVTGPSVTSSLPLMTLELTGVTGDTDAIARLVVTDNASQSRRHLRWGMESRWYPTSSPPGLILDSDSLVTTGFAGTGSTQTGAYDPNATGNNVISCAMRLQAQGVCGTGDQPHVGSFRVFARVHASATSCAVRLSWQDSDGPLGANPYVAPVAVGWNDIDLGVITVEQASLGSQRWTGRVEAYSTDVGGETLKVDYLMLIPVERYGKAYASYSYTPGSVVGYDEFTTTGGALDLEVAPLGGTWATSGVASDFTESADTVIRSTAIAEATPRFAVLGSTNYTDVEVGGTAQYSTTGNDKAGFVIARWADASNYFALRILSTETGKPVTASLIQRVAGVDTTLASAAVTGFHTLFTLRLVVFASGRAAGYVSAGGATIAVVEATSSVLATGGTLATGKPGFADQSLGTLATTRTHDNFYIAQPPAEPITIHSAQSLEVNAFAAKREDSTGTYWGNPPAYVGSRFLLPCAGTRNRKARLAVAARRANIDTSADDNIADSTTVQAYFTPRYLVVPRA